MGWTLEHSRLAAQCMHPSEPNARWTRTGANTWDATWMAYKLRTQAYWEDWMTASGLDD